MNQPLQRVGNEWEKLFEAVQEKLGLYVYVLIDPDGQKIFYVGKGGGSDPRIDNDRPIDHFRMARKYADSPSSENDSRPLMERILEIWNRDQNVGLWIIRRNIKDVDICLEIEAAVIDALSLTANKPLNAQRGHGSLNSGRISWEDVLRLNPQPVSPKSPYGVVFIFNIHKQVHKQESTKEATRKYWDVSEQWRDVENAVALGVWANKSAGVYEIEKWYPDGGKYAFDGRDVTDTGEIAHELARRDCSSVIERAAAPWAYGSFLIVEFDGKGHCRFLRGSKDKEWFDL
jgi:hypothetical protein